MQGCLVLMANEECLIHAHHAGVVLDLKGLASGLAFSRKWNMLASLMAPSVYLALSNTYC